MNPAPRRIVGTATATTAIGAGMGAALAQLLVHWVPSEAEVEGAWTVILSAILGLGGGYLSPPQRPAVVTPSPDERLTVNGGGPGPDPSVWPTAQG